MAGAVRRVSGVISAARIAADIEAIAGCSENGPGDGPESSARRGYSRPTFSPPWGAARDYVIAQARAAGGEARIDAAGNVHIRHHSLGWEAPVWLCGSHIDSVPSGGKYDGVMGVVIPLEVMRSAPSAPLEIIVFAEEEGTTFGFGMVGSRLWAGVESEAQLDEILALRNRHGQSVADAGVPWGLDVDALHAAAAGSPVWTSRLDPSRYFGMIEVHAEQGLSLWSGPVPVAAVSRINGRRQYAATITGQANHAGSTGMVGRRDALSAAAELILAVERTGTTLARELPHTVATVGSAAVVPGAANVIPGAVSLTIDVRAQDESMLGRADAELRAAAADISTRRGTPTEIVCTERIAPSPLSEEVADRLVAAAETLGVTLPVVPSGALHDAAIVSAHVPTAMVFVASRDGISHNPAEFSRIEDIVQAAKIVATAISR
jgi:allantoate deiminase